MPQNETTAIETERYNSDRKGPQNRLEGPFFMGAEGGLRGKLDEPHAPISSSKYGCKSDPK